MQKPMGLKDISGLNLRMACSVLEEHPTRMGAILRNEMERGSVQNENFCHVINNDLSREGGIPPYVISDSSYIQLEKTKKRKKKHYVLRRFIPFRICIFS